MKRRNKHLRPTGPAALALTGIVLALGAALLAQPAMFGKITGFKVPEFFDPPNQRQVRAMLTGAEAIPDADGRIKIRELQVETFRETGERELVVTAPDCIYDPKARTASSSGPIQARTEDRRLQIEGRGFLLVMTNKTLTISNNIHTVIRDVGTAPKKP